MTTEWDFCQWLAGYIHLHFCDFDGDLTCFIQIYMPIPLWNNCGTTIVKYKSSGLRSMKEEEVKNYFIYQYLVYSIFWCLKLDKYGSLLDLMWFRFPSCINVIKLQKVGHKFLECLHSWQSAQYQSLVTLVMWINLA